MTPTFVMCEGVHDVGFIGRVLEANGATPYTKRIKDYPSKIGKILAAQYSRRVVDEGRFSRNLKNQGTIVSEPKPVFSAAYQWESERGSRLFLLFRSDGNSNQCFEFLKQLLTLSELPDPVASLGPVSILMTCDSDSKGIASHSEAMGQLISKLQLEEPSQDAFRCNSLESIRRTDNAAIGGFVFTDHGGDKGTLEDVYHPLLSLDNDWARRLPKAEAYLNEFAKVDSKVRGGDHPVARLRKASMTIAGQIDSPGYALSVVLRDTTAISKETFAEHAVCRTLWEYIASLYPLVQ